MITLQIQHWQSQFFTINHRGLLPYFLERLRKVKLFRSPGWPTLCPEHRGWGCRRETKDAAGPLDNPSSDGEGGVLTVHHVTKVPSPRTSRSSWNVAERVQEGPGCSSPWGCLFSFNKEREWKAWECSTYILQSIMRILTCSPLWKALMKRRKRASGWPRGERSLAACHSRGRAEKVGDQRAVTELGPCPSRKVRSYAEKRAQGEPVVASCSLQRDKRARGDKSLPMGAFAVLTLALTVFWKEHTDWESRKKDIGFSLNVVENDSLRGLVPSIAPQFQAWPLR